MLTQDERERYARNLLIPNFDVLGQERLHDAKVLVVGLGGLGSPAAFYLAAAGVGTVGLLDSDTVALSNLQRQILHATERVGHPKAASAAETLSRLNPEVTLHGYEERLTEATAPARLGEYDLVVEACDTFEAKFLVNDACVALGKPFTTAGVVGLSGQAMLVAPGRTPCLRCLLPDPPDEIAGQGVLGAAAGVLGCLEALEALRWLAGLWRPREDGAGRLHRLDGDGMRVTTIETRRRRECRCARLWSQQ